MKEGLEKKKVFVTGAGGFIGSRLVQRLVEYDCKVTAMVHYNSLNSWNNLEYLPEKILKKVKVLPADVIDVDCLRKNIKGQEVVFHLAALISIPYSYVSPRMFVETNILGSLNVFQACLENKVKRIVHTSTSEVYGSARYVPIDEKHPLQAQSPYSATKMSADRLAESFFKSFQLPVVTIRPFNTFGPGQSARAIIPALIMQFLSSSKIKAGSLFPVRDFNYVDNTVDGFIKCAESDKAIGKVINVGYGEGCTIGDLINKMADIIGVGKFEIISDKKRIRPEKSEVQRLVCNYSKAKRLLSYKPAISFEEGLKRTISWIKENKHRYKASIYNI